MSAAEQPPLCSTPDEYTILRPSSSPTPKPSRSCGSSSIWPGALLMASPMREGPEVVRPLITCGKRSLRRGIPLHDPRVGGHRVHQRKPARVVPGHAARTAVVGRDLAAHFLRHHDAFGHRILAEEKRLVAVAGGPVGLGDVGLLDEPAALVA